MKAKLTKYFKNKAVIDVFRKKIDEYPLCGIIVGFSQDFVLLQKVSEQITTDGFALLRKEDISKISNNKKNKMQENIIKKRKMIKRPKGNIPIDSIEKFLISASKKYKLFVINQEKDSPDSCLIGRFIKLEKSDIFFKLIDSLAKWEKNLEKIKISAITMIEFGGLYEEGLYLATLAY